MMFVMRDNFKMASSKYLAGFLMILSLLGSVAVTTGIGHHIGKRGLAVQNIAKGEIGVSVDGALKTYQAFVIEFYAKIYAEITNYSKWPLSTAEYKITRGVTTSVPLMVSPGYVEAWTAKQQIDTDGTEGIVAWSTSPGRFCAIYWRVDHYFFGRSPNKLGIGCTSNENNKTNILSSNDYGSLDFMKYQTYSTSLPTLQFCDENILCVQAIMSSSHKAEATIHVIPKYASDLAPTMVGRMGQRTLDQILDESNLCKLGCNSGEIAAYALSKQLYFAITLTLLAFTYM